MNLRTQLSLFFGGLIVAVLSVVIITNYERFYTTLERGLKEQFSLEPYLQLAEVDRTLLQERANALVDRTPVLNGVRRMNSVLNDEGVEKLKAIRRDTTNSDDFIQLSSIYEQMIQVLHTAGEEGQDLVVLASQDGVVIAEGFNKVMRPDRKLEPTVSQESLSGASFWKTLVQFDAARGYLEYPNQKLYLYSMASFESSYSYEGVALVGLEIDRAFMRQIARGASDVQSEAEETHALVLYGADKVVGSSDTAVALGRELAKIAPQGDTWNGPGGDAFLVKSADLKAYYLSDEEQQSLKELGVQDQLPDNPQIGRVYLLRNLSGVKEAAFAGARNTLLLGLGALLLSLLAIPLLARRFTEPIGELSHAMKNVGEGELEPIDEERISSITEVKEAALSFNQMVIGLKQKKILEHFVPEGTRKEIEELQGEVTALGGKRWERTIMFSDLRGFTSMSEQMTPDEVMGVLNKYLHVMSRAIRLKGGDINEYIGDAILAVFEHPDQAVEAAIAMNEELVELRKDRSIDALAGLAQGIGLHTGPLVEGNIGEENKRLKRAVVGDTVNLAARIQDRSREGKHSCIFLSGETKAKLTLRNVRLVHFGDESFKGKAEPVAVWEVKI